MIKHFVIDVEGTTQENALFQGDDFICYADDVETMVEKLNELKSERDYYIKKQCEYFNDWNLSHLDNIDLRKENTQLRADYESLTEEWISLDKENKRLKEENKRMINKLNELAFEFLNHDMISMGKAVEISEMSYHDFLKYRAEQGNPMELQL